MVLNKDDITGAQLNSPTVIMSTAAQIFNLSERRDIHHLFRVIDVKGTRRPCPLLPHGRRFEGSHVRGDSAMYRRFQCRWNSHRATAFSMPV